MSLQYFTAQLQVLTTPMFLLPGHTGRQRGVLRRENLDESDVQVSNVGSFDEHIRACAA